MTRVKKEEAQEAKAEVAKILTKATPAAARILTDTLSGDEGTYSMKIDCAKEILNRVFGKAGSPIDDAADSEIKVVMEKSVKNDAV